MNNMLLINNIYNDNYMIKGMTLHVVIGEPSHGHCATNTPPHIKYQHLDRHQKRSQRNVSHLCRFHRCRLTPAEFLSPVRLQFWVLSRMPVDLPEIQIHDPVCPGFPEEDAMDVSIEVSDVHIPILSWIQAGKGTHAIRWTRRRCCRRTSTWMCGMSRGMRRNVVTCR